MIAFVLSLLLIVGTALFGKYTSFLTKEQLKFILVSSVLYIIIFGVILTLLTSNRGRTELVFDNNIFIPLIFYVLWYISSAIITNLFTGNNDYTGFFDSTNSHMSVRNIMPR